ncbi:MAG: ankyrin repeat domain-containing protein [Streptosporangiaceae bacterium]
MLAAHPGLAAARIADDKGSATPLHAAADWPGFFPRGPEVVAVLIGAGADPDAPMEGSWHAETPLHWAASSDDVEVARALIDGGADIEAAAAQDHDLPLALVQEGQEVGEYQVVFDLGLRSLDRDGVGELDEPDSDLGALVVKLALEIFSRVRPVLGEVILDPVGADRVEDSPQPAVGIGRIDRPPDYLRGFGLAAPQVPAHARARSHRAVQDRSVLERHRALADPGVHERHGAQGVLDDGGDRREPVIQVMGQHPDGI